MNNNLLTVQEVVQLTGLQKGVIWRAVRNGDLPVARKRRPMLIKRQDALEWANSRNPPPITKEELNRLYCDEGLSITGVSEQTGVDRMVIHRLMVKWNIPRRPQHAHLEGGGITKYIKDKKKWRENVSKAQKGKKLNLTQEERKRRSKLAKSLNKELWGNGTFGSKEWQEKQRQSHAGEKSWRWQGGSDHYRGPNWQKQRRKARKRDNYTCLSCNITERQLGQELAVHHVIPYRSFSDYREANRLENLRSLCPSCHGTEDHEAERRIMTNGRENH